MNLLESKVIQTKLEKEIFIDESTNIELKILHDAEKNFPFYKFIVSIEMMRIRRNEFYGTKKAFFGIRVTEDLQSFIVFEPDQQSIFAIKNEQERQAVMELIDYLLTESVNFKQLVISMVEKLKQVNVEGEKENKELKTKLTLLERLLKIHHEEIKFPLQKKLIA